LVRDVAGTVSVHNVAGGATAPNFAVENDMVGKGITDAYATGDQVYYRTFAEGACVNALLASGQNVAANAPLQSAGNGYLSAASTADNVIGFAREAINASAAAARIRVHIGKGYTSA